MKKKKSFIYVSITSHLQYSEGKGQLDNTVL